MATLVDQYVRRLDVAVDEPLRMSSVERTRDLRDDLERPGGSQRAFTSKHRAQVCALDVAHREVEACVSFARVVHRDDVRMIEARGNPRLAEKALAESLVVGVTRSEDLEGNVPVEAAVVRAVHLSHAAAADQLLDPVAADLDTARNTHQLGHDRSILLPEASPWTRRAGAAPSARPRTTVRPRRGGGLTVRGWKGHITHQPTLSCLWTGQGREPELHGNGVSGSRRASCERQTATASGGSSEPAVSAHAAVTLGWTR